MRVVSHGRTDSKSTSNSSIEEKHKILQESTSAAQSKTYTIMESSNLGKVYDVWHHGGSFWGVQPYT